MPAVLYRMASALLLTATLAACTSYAPLPLDKRPSLKTTLGALRHEGTVLPAVLGVDDIARLAVENNLDLVAVRTQVHLAEAQTLAAGVLANPSINGNYGFLTGGAGTMGSIAAGVSEDVKSLVTQPAKHEAADQAAQQVAASILWQEWQVIGKVRLLATDLVEGEKSCALLRRMRALLQDRLDRGRVALARGDTTFGVLSPDLVALGDLQKQIDDLDRQQLTRRQDLNALIGLAPEVAIPLVRQLDLPDIDPDKVDALLATLVDRRPDLVALQRGYQAQEAKLRGAVLAQFPALALGVAGGRDNSDVRTIGPQITLELPIFDRNQGAIAIERATREQLHAEFTARLSAAVGEVQAMMASQRLIEKQLATASGRADEHQGLTARAEAAYVAGDLDERSYVDLATSGLAKRLEVVALEQSLLDQRVAIATLVGAGMPPVRPFSGEPTP